MSAKSSEWACDCFKENDFEKLHDPMCPLSPLPNGMKTPSPSRANPFVFAFHGLHPLRECKNEYVLFVLRATGGNKTRAAEVLGIDRRNLYRILERIEAKK